MAKALRESTYLNSLFSAGLFKKNQGRIARLWTWIVVTAAVVWGAWTLQARLLVEYGDLIRIGVPTLVVLAGAWAAFRLVHFPRFADFLIDVEGEMGKVSWPGWSELWRATVVVLVTMFLFSVVLFGYDMLWQYFLRWCSILQA
ncbi:MAG TPA: preprotein translocase subunit SecE [Planctomycetaceae bacterium]|nr:preprotein translocase subunit SecE [Planctomycetaceae bacterium]